MSYLTRHFQMKAALVGNIPNHATRERMHKQLHAANVPAKAVRVYTKALLGSPNVLIHVANATLMEDTRYLAISIGGEYRPKRANQHTKNIVVTGFRRFKGENLICYTQGDKVGSMTIAEWREKVQP